MSRGRIINPGKATKLVQLARASTVRNGPPFKDRGLTSRHVSKTTLPTVNALFYSLIESSSEYSTRKSLSMTDENVVLDKSQPAFSLVGVGTGSLSITTLTASSSS
jgi:hypothetical protein